MDTIDSLVLFFIYWLGYGYFYPKYIGELWILWDGFPLKQEENLPRWRKLCWFWCLAWPIGFLLEKDLRSAPHKY